MLVGLEPYSNPNPNILTLRYECVVPIALVLWP